MQACKILIVDDDADDVEILSDAFLKTGVECVHHADTAPEAFLYLLEASKKNELPDMIITDHYLRGATGVEFLQDLKSNEQYKNILVIVLSAIKPENDIEKYREIGAVDYLIKPSSYAAYLQIANYIKQMIA